MKQNHSGHFQLTGTISLLSANYNSGILAGQWEENAKFLICGQTQNFVVLYYFLTVSFQSTSFNTGSEGGIQIQYNSYKLSNVIKDKPK